MDNQFTPNKFTFQLLNKTPTFVPTPHRCPHQEIKQQTKDFVRKLQWQHSFINQSNLDNKNRFGICKSQRWPPESLVPSLILEKSKVILSAVDSIVNSCTCCFSGNNLSRDELQELERIKMSDIVVRPADKGQRWTIMSKESYESEAIRQLSDNDNYIQIPSPVDRKVFYKIKQCLTHLRNNRMITAAEFNFLMPENDYSCRKLNILPKIHKTLWPQSDMPPGRPIISDVNSVSRNVANFLDYFLKPLAQMAKSYLSDTYHVIGILKGIALPENAIFFTLDVESLYTKVPIDETITLISDLFLSVPNSNRPDLTIITLLNLLLKNNDFEFNSTYWLQKSGAAMGGAFSGSFCNIFMDFWETNAIRSSTLKPYLWTRYEDDIFGIWTHSEHELKQFFNHLNRQHDRIRLTPTYHTEKLNFLDLEIYRLNDAIGYRTSFKQTDSHLILPNSSYHPKYTFKGVVYSQIHRFVTHSTTREDFLSTLRIVQPIWRNQNFTRTFIRSVTKSVLTNTGQLRDWKTGFTRCDKINCRVCPYAKNLTVIKSNTSNIVYPILHKLNCQTVGAIYLIQCDICSVMYVGQTSRTIEARIIEHISAIKNKNSNNNASNVAIHYNSEQCCLRNFKFSGIEMCNLEVKRLKKENLWIKRLNTLNNGLNATLNSTFHNETKLILPYSNCSERVANTVKSLCSDFTKTTRVYTKHRNLKQILSK